MSARGEPTGQPISALSTIAMLTDDGLRDAQAHYETLLQARPKPYLLDDATIARVRRGNAMVKGTKSRFGSAHRRDPPV